MGDKSKIEWTDASWTPIRARNLKTAKVGWFCEHVTPGCEHCYAESMNARLGTGLAFKPGHRKDVEIFLDETMLTAPLRWKRPRMIFVCSMTDLFADFVTDEWIDRMFAVMALAPQHVFQVLTKRAERMHAYFDDADHRAEVIGCALGDMLDGDWIWGESKQYRTQIEGMISLAHGLAPDDQAFAQEDFLPLRNVWIGVSTEDQKRANERVPLLLDTPAAIRFVSAEPLIGPINFRKLMLDEHTWVDAITGWHGQRRGPGPIDQVLKELTSLPPQTGRLHQIITGGESGPNARPAHPQWFRDIRDQCSFLTAFFHKQNGEFASVSEVEGAGAHHEFPDGSRVRRVGKTKAGRLLDGIEHNGMPEGHHHAAN